MCGSMKKGWSSSLCRQAILCFLQATVQLKLHAVSAVEDGIVEIMNSQALGAITHQHPMKCLKHFFLIAKVLMKQYAALIK